jgi:formylglycine-generating enzyme required for sulfatase activity
MHFSLIPAGRFVMGAAEDFADESPPTVVTVDRPFYLGRFEVTNEQYAQFDPQHDSGVINERWKDRSRRGTPINQPDAPVVRITWQQAKAFCDWLTEQTGKRCSLPTEAEWEWACRAGSASRFHVGEYESGQEAFANIADETARRWNHGRAEEGYRDDCQFTARGGGFDANAWGLYDMHGNVAEWCLSAYRSYPYEASDGRNDPHAPGARVVRGGSWNDTLRFATSASRWRYEPYKPVYNVGFRVRVDAEEGIRIATTRRRE